MNAIKVALNAGMNHLKPILYAVVLSDSVLMLLSMAPVHSRSIYLHSQPSSALSISSHKPTIQLYKDSSKNTEMKIVIQWGE